MQIAIHDLDPEALSDFSLTIETYFLEADELAEFIANSEAFANCRKLYMGHDLLPDEEQEKILRSHGVEISIIPDYYYRDLQEG